MATTTSAAASAPVLDAGQGDPAVAPSTVDDIAISLPPGDHLSPAIDETQGPLAAQLFEFSEMDLFPESENLLCAANLSFPSDADKLYCSEPLESDKFQNYPNENSISTSSSTLATAKEMPIMTDNNNTISLIFDTQDELDNKISTSIIDFSNSPSYSVPYLTVTHQDKLDFTSIEPEVQLTGPAVPFMPPTLPSSVYEEDCLSAMPPFLRFNPSASSSSSFSFQDTPSMESFFPGSLNSTLAADNPGTYNKNLLARSEQQQIEPQYTNGSFCPDQLERVYSSSDIQSLSNENQQIVNGALNTPMPTDISSLEDSGFKAGKLSVEERKEKIHKYMKKRNERNFNKKIKYACRKTLADSRPRVRGRFAKNDEFGDTHTPAGSQHEDYSYDGVHVAMKEEDLVNSSDIFGHMSGVNPFNCGFPIQSWI